MGFITQKTDEELAAQIQKGDKESFALLMQRYEQKIYRYGKKFFSNEEDIKDSVQEVFIRAYMNIKSFDSHRKFSSWIYRIAHNEFINVIKKKNNEKLLFINFDFDILFPHLVSSKSAIDDTDNLILKKSLNSYLAQIGVKYREPLILYYFEELDYKEISDILRIPISTVGVRLRRGRNILKNIIERSKI